MKTCSSIDNAFKEVRIDCFAGDFGGKGEG
jgi:hypothetical protein